MFTIPEEDSINYDSVLESSISLSNRDWNYSCSPRSPDTFNSSLPDSVFKIKNIDTGEEIDLRDENKEMFGRKVKMFLNTDEEYFKLRRSMNERLWEAIEQNDLGLVKNLIDKKKHGGLAAHANAKGLNDWNALHMAASDGLADICTVLLDMGDHTDVDARTSMNRTPLHLAVLHNHLEVAKVLILNKADINAVDNEYNTSIHYASMQGFPLLCKWLLMNDPNLTVKNHLERTPMDLSLNSEIFQIFLDYSGVKQIPIYKTPYSRILISSTLLHNSREDHINNILLKAANPPRLRDLQTFNDRPKLQQFNATRGIKELIIPGSKVGPKDFKALCQLGKGSFGEVYLVEKKDTGVQYALKVLRKDKVLGSNLIKYAFAERNILLHISHPFIVKLNYAFQTPDKLAMVMDFCPNGDLGMQIARDKRFTEEKAKFYACEVLLAIEELHSHGIIFRDLKPDNIVLDQDGHARLTDFGLSKEGVNEGQLAKSFCGSVAYLAPEMLKRTGHTRSVDWYLFGVLIFEMLVGAPPYYSTSREQLFNNIQKGKLKVPKYVGQCSRDLIKQLLNRDPLKRLGSSKKDAEDIKNHSFFKGVDWKACLMKKISVPPFREIKRITREIDLEKIFKMEDENFEKPRLDGWSVLVPS